MLIERHISDSSTVALWFLVLFLAFAFIFRFGNRRIQDIFASFFSEKVFLKKIKEEYFLKSYTAGIMYVVAGIAIVLNLLYSLKSTIDVKVFSLAFLVIVSPWIKVFLASVVSLFISNRNTILLPIYIFELVTYLVAGITLIFTLPMLLWLPPNQHINIVVGILLFVTLFRIIKSAVLAFKAKISLFYIILYFCALEMLPFLVLMKVAIIF